MEPKLINLTSPNKRKDKEFNYISLTPKNTKETKHLLSIKQDIKPCLKNFYSTSKKFFSSNNNIFSKNLNNSKKNFLIPNQNASISKTNIKPKCSLSFLNLTNSNISALNTPKLITDTKSLYPKHFFSEIRPNDINLKSFLSKKRKYMTSEEIELEQIEKERTASKKMMEKNRNLYYKSLVYTPIRIIPTPLTTFKPFNLSSNKNSKYIKEGKSNTLYEINKLNEKIRLKMKQKIEALTDTKTKNQILLNNTDFLKKQNSLYNDLFKKPDSINNINLDKSKNIDLSIYNLSSKKISLDENKDINIIKNYMTPQKIYEYNKGMNAFESLNNGKFNFCLSSHIKSLTEKNKYFGNSKIMNYYLSSIKKKNAQ